MSARALITVLCVVSLSGPAFATSSWVLGPQSQLQSKRLINALWSASGCDGVEMEMKRDAVVASMRCDGSQLHTLTISKKGEGRDTTVTLRGDERLAQELRKTLRRLVAESDLGWQSVRPDVVPVYEIDAEQRTRVLAERERAKARINPPTGSVNATAVTDPQRDQVLSMRSPPSLGLIMSLIGRHRGEPRLWAAAAERALGAGRVHEAGALMDVAARMKEANQTTWETQDKLLGGDGLGLYAHLGLLLFCLAVWLWLLARFKTEHSTEVQGARYGVFMTVMVAVVALMTLPEAQKAVSPAPVPQALNAPLAGGGASRTLRFGPHRGGRSMPTARANQCASMSG